MRRTTLYAIVGVLSVALLISLIANAVQSSNKTVKNLSRSYITDTNRMARSVKKPVTTTKTKSKTARTTTKAKRTTTNINKQESVQRAVTRAKLTDMANQRTRLNSALYPQQTPSTLPYYTGNNARYNTNGASQHGGNAAQYNGNTAQYGTQSNTSRGSGLTTNTAPQYQYRVLPDGTVARTALPQATQNPMRNYSYSGTAVR